MLAQSLAFVAKACSAEIIQQGNLPLDSKQVTSIAIDSRKVTAGTVFFAMAGERVDGHNFLDDVVEKGAVAAVVENVESVEADKKKESAEKTALTALPLLKVASTRQALADVASAYREKLTMPVLSMTGSSGKTTTKEMLNTILASFAKVSATLGNQNNELGVPLTLFAIEPDADFAVVEMGAAEQGDIAYLMNIAKPDAVAITNIGHAHVGRFGSQAIIAKTKAEIYSSLKPGAKAVVNIDEPYSAEWLELLSEHSYLTFSLNQQTADIYAKNIQQSSDGSRCDVVILGNSYQLTLNVPGVHNIMNALCAAALAKAVNAPHENIVAALAEFQPVSGRFVSQKASWGGVLIDDSYNANPASVKAAIDVLVQYAGDTVLVLGDLAELGEYSQTMHRELGGYAVEKGVKQLLTVGEDSRFAAEAFAGSKHFEDKASLQAFIKEAMQENHVVLFKGSRSSAMESLVEYFTVEGAS